jgi:hypothetical protein
MQMDGGLPSESDLAPVHPKNPGIPSRGGSAGHDLGPRQEPELHEAESHPFGQIKGLENATFPFKEIGQGPRVESPSTPTMPPSPAASSKAPETPASHEEPT